MLYGPLNLADSDPGWWDVIAAAYSKLMSFIHKQNDVTPDTIKKKVPQEFIQTMTGIFNDALEEGIKTEDLSDGTREKMQKSNYVFSGEKTFHEMKEAFALLFDENGNRKTFEQFSNDVQTINENYNKNYLKTEYNFATNSGLMAARWESFQEGGDKYFLQYRTAEDERVRLTHRPLDEVTLPIDDPFWDDFFPPNGWGCRCTVVQVRKKKYQPSDTDSSVKLGQEATSGKNKMFRFNPGKQGLTFPKHNAYTVSLCKECNSDKMNLYKEKNELCLLCSKLKCNDQ
jgi:SPP1 gp7 family putative phage head morphogenesis protein